MKRYKEDVNLLRGLLDARRLTHRYIMQRCQRHLNLHANDDQRSR